MENLKLDTPDLQTTNLNDLQPESELQKLEKSIRPTSPETKPAPEKAAIKTYRDLFLELAKENPAAQEIINNLLTGKQITITEETLKIIAKIISSVDENKKGQFIPKTNVPYELAQKWAYSPTLIRKWHTLNCSGAASIGTAILKNLGAESYFATPSGHAVNLVKLKNNDWFYVDPRNNIVQKMNIKEINFEPNQRVNFVRLHDKISGYSLIPFYTSLQDGINETISGNHESLEKELESPEGDAKLAKETLGTEFEIEKNYPRIEEIKKLQDTKEWQAEEKNAGAEDDVNNGFTEFAATIGNENVSTIIESIKTNPEKFKNLLKILKEDDTKDLQIANESLKSLQRDIKSQFNIDEKVFFEAHKKFRATTERIRQIDPNHFTKQVEGLLKHAISR